MTPPRWQPKQVCSSEKTRFNVVQYCGGRVKRYSYEYNCSSFTAQAVCDLNFWKHALRTWATHMYKAHNAAPPAAYGRAWAAQVALLLRSHCGCGTMGFFLQRSINWRKKSVDRLCSLHKGKQYTKSIESEDDAARTHLPITMWSPGLCCAYIGVCRSV